MDFKEIKEADAPELPTDEEIEESFKEPDLENLSVEELERLLNKHIENEEYEEAARVKSILSSKKR